MGNSWHLGRLILSGVVLMNIALRLKNLETKIGPLDAPANSLHETN